MKRISLTQGKFAFVDDEDFEKINQIKWYAHKERSTFYALNGGGRTGMKRMHRLIMNLSIGQRADHRNGNGLDNQKSNLRLCNNAQNLQNARKHKTYGQHKICSSKYKGVCWDKSKKKWQVNICVNKKMLTIGRFDSEIEAAKAYDCAATKYFGEFAYTNFGRKVS